MHVMREIDRIWKDQYEEYRSYRLKRVWDKNIKKRMQRCCLSKDQKHEIDNFYIENYGKKVDYTWHEYCVGLTRKFDVRYFSESLYFAKFERFENLNVLLNDILEDKNFIPIVAKGVGICMPRMLLNCTCGVYRNAKNEFINRSEVEKFLDDCGEVVIKPSLDTWGGRNIELVCFKQGVDQYSGKTIENILEGYGDDFVVQERLRSHESLRKIYPESINNFRVVSYRWRDEIRICPAYLRVGQGGNFVDNVCSGGLAVGVDNCGKFVGPAMFGQSNDYVIKHPDTGVIFEGYEAPGFVKILNAVRKMHESIPQIGCCNWDFTLDEDEEPVLIEANVMSGGGCGCAQITHAKAFFGEHTAEILRWLRVMKKTPLSKWEQYMFGYGVD